MKYKIKMQQGLSLEMIAIRKAVFVDEQGFYDEFDEVDDTAYHVVVYENSTPIGTGRVFLNSDNQYFLGRIAVVKSHRKCGIGRIIVTALEEKARELGGEIAVLSSQLQAKGFYSALGYCEEGEEYLDQHSPHIKMAKNL